MYRLLEEMIRGRMAANPELQEIVMDPSGKDGQAEEMFRLFTERTADRQCGFAGIRGSIYTMPSSQA